ncbi:MAG: ubiquinone/menaquinone biosynthesis methyltransferase [Gemmatimonadota bacterium]|jgi:demethylmenaquinone methyltransferase/2-methoxy-6-polyprenyl-1,4-benzoquinol methylase
MQPAPQAASQAGSEASPKAGTERARQVRRIFSEIAPRYDLLNHVLSLNIDRRWRRAAVRRLDWARAPDGTYLDACAGTFDLALELSGQKGFGGRVVASDFAHPMLVQGSPKIATDPVSAVCGDSLLLPFADGTFAGATVGFGVRNLADLSAGIRELHRVLEPGARLVVLEFTTPPNRLVRAGYLFYFNRVLPIIGRLVSGHPWAYTYLPESVSEFPGPRELGGIFEDAGFGDVGWKLLSGGIAAIHWGVA